MTVKILWVALLCVTISCALVNYEVSCLNAKTISLDSLSTCSMVNWNTANLYPKTGFNVYNPGPQLSEEDQDSVASNLIENIFMTASPHVPDKQFCKQAIKRFLCMDVFPYCPSIGYSVSSVSYLPTCQLQCEQMNNACLFVSRSRIDCSTYPTTGCSMTIPNGYFVLPQNEGSYSDMSKLYVIFGGIWLLLMLVYVHQTLNTYFLTHFVFCRVNLICMFGKVAIIMTSYMFWIECNGKGDLCNSTLAQIISALHHIYETGIFFLLLIIAKGWNTTREHLLKSEWHEIYVVLAIFYTISVVGGTVFTANSAEQNNNYASFAVFVTMVYSYIYYFIVKYCLHELRLLRSQVVKLSPHMSTVASDQIKLKHRMFCGYLILIGAFIVVEIVYHVCFTQNMFIRRVVLMYEISQYILIVTLSALFRPYEHHGLFFMVPTSLNRDLVRFPELVIEQGTRARRPIPIVEISAPYTSMPTGSSTNSQAAGADVQAKTSLLSSRNSNSTHNTDNSTKIGSTIRYSRLARTEMDDSNHDNDEEKQNDGEAGRGGGDGVNGGGRGGRISSSSDRNDPDGSGVELVPIDRNISDNTDRGHEAVSNITSSARTATVGAAVSQRLTLGTTPSHPNAPPAPQPQPVSQSVLQSLSQMVRPATQTQTQASPSPIQQASTRRRTAQQQQHAQTYLGEDEIDLTPIFRNLLTDLTINPAGANTNNRANGQAPNIVTSMLNSPYYMYHEPNLVVRTGNRVGNAAGNPVGNAGGIPQPVASQTATAIATTGAAHGRIAVSSSAPAAHRPAQNTTLTSVAPSPTQAPIPMPAATTPISAAPTAAQVAVPVPATAAPQIVRFNNILLPEDQVKLIAVVAPDNAITLGAFKSSSSSRGGVDQNANTQTANNSTAPPVTRGSTNLAARVFQML